MNVGLIIYGSLETLTGGFLYDSKVVNYLRGMGDRVEVFSLPWRNYPRHLLDNFSSKLFESLSASNLDVLIEDELNHPSLLWVNSRLRAKTNYPIVSIVHHLRSSELRPNWQNTLYELLERKYLSTVDGFVCNSHTTRLSVESIVGDFKPSLVAFPGRDNVVSEITEAQLERSRSSDGPLKILFVGSLIPRKELHTLISALLLLPREAWRLEVVGSLENDPGYSNGIKRKIEENQLHANVKLLGTLKGTDLANAYGSNHILAVPSSYEGFGIVYLEAMGFGLPALGSTGGAAHEIITHGIDGFLVQPGDVGAITKCLEELMLNRDRLHEMSLASVKRHQSHPTWLESSEIIREFLKELVRQRKHGA